MKTKEQILKWLDKQPWKNEFYENCVKYGAYPTYDEDFITTAFDYELTAQGNEVWSRRSVEYAKWYASNDKPMSWKEYCEQNPITANDYFINKNCDIFRCDTKARRDFEIDANVMPRNLCEAFVAYMKLIQLRNAWVNNLVGCVMPYRIATCLDRIEVHNLGYHAQGLSFPNKIVAREFIDTFKDLLETAKPLL